MKELLAGGPFLLILVGILLGGMAGIQAIILPKKIERARGKVSLMENQARTFQEGDASPELKAEVAKIDAQISDLGHNGLSTVIAMEYAIIAGLAILAASMVIVGCIWTLLRKRKKLPGASSTDRPGRPY